MFSVANLLERAMRGGNIDTHYRLAKVIGISQGAMTGYKSGKSMPDARVLEQLCALSGDDLAVVAAQIQAERERTPEAKQVWLMIAKRLSGRAQPAILAVVFAIALIAASAGTARASGLVAHDLSYSQQLIHRVKWSFWPVVSFAMVRLRRFAGLFRLCVWACA
jgi:transcriptional regulator with XRE-family HTH domain